MRIAVVFLLIVGTLGRVESQIRPKAGERGKNSLIDSDIRDQRKQPTHVKTLFDRIERGIAGGSVSLFGAYFGKQVSMSIDRGENGYFSTSQAFSILQSYFSNHKPTQFSFSRMSEGASVPFATGRLSFIAKGNKESAQVYVSLKQQDSEWVISQFNIY